MFAGMITDLLRATVALVALSGCHLWMPYASDDSAVVADGRAEHDATVGHDASADGRGDPDAVAASEDATDAFCQVGPTAQASGDCDCLPDQLDCDALPGARDPQPDICNRLLYEADFEANPLTNGEWTKANGEWDWSPGCLHQRATSNPPGTQQWSWARAGGADLTDPAYLVEARIRLEAAGEADFWQVGIAARLSASFDGVDLLPAAFISCVARVDRVLDTCYGCAPQRKVIHPDLRIESKSADFADWEGAWPLDNPGGIFGGDAGEVLLMQLWVQPQPAAVYCRLYDAAGQLRREAFYRMYDEDAAYLKYLPREAGGVGLRTWGRAASFDYLRVFELR